MALKLIAFHGKSNDKFAVGRTAERTEEKKFDCDTLFLEMMGSKNHSELNSPIAMTNSNGSAS